MLFDAARQTLANCFEFSHYKLGVTGFYGLSLAVCWLIWRIWTFTIHPLLHPEKPLTVPYLIPLVGHTLQFLRNPEKTLSIANKYFSGDAPYALYVGLGKLVIVRNVNDVATLWKNTKACTFDGFIQGVFNGIGVPKKSYSPMFAEFHTLPPYDQPQPAFITQNPNQKRYIDVQEDWIKEQLQPGSKMDDVLGKTLEFMAEGMEWDRFPQKSIVNESGDTRIVNLFNWTRYTLVEATTKAFLGPEIFDIDPNFVQHYIEWEDTSWKVAHQIPPFLSGDMIKARDLLVGALETFYSLPSTKRPNIAWVLERMQREQQRLGLNCREASSISLTMLWGFNLNSFRMVFWVFIHILCDRSLYDDILNEAKGSRNSNGKIDPDFLKRSCPTFEAAWNEGLRLYNNAAVVRAATIPVVIGGKTIDPGTTIMGFFRTFALSEEFVKTDPLAFDARRWLENPALVKSKAWFPFSGGKTHCPGRVIAKLELFYFIATAITRFQIEPNVEGNAGDQKKIIPQPAPEKLNLTVMDPRADVLLRVVRKADI